MTETFTIEMTADVKPKGLDKDDKLQVLLLCHGLDATDIAEMYRFALSNRAATVNITLLPPGESKAEKNGQQALPTNVQCPGCHGYETKPMQDWPNMYYCNVCRDEFMLPDKAESEDPTPCHYEAAPAILWIDQSTWDGLAALNSREELHTGRVRGIWQPDAEQSARYIIADCIADEQYRQTAVCIRIYPVAGEDSPDYPVGGAQGPGTPGWVVHYDGTEYFCTDERIFAKLGVPPTWCVEMTDAYAAKSIVDGSIWESKDNVDAFMLCMAIEDGCTYEVVEWEPPALWIVVRQDMEGNEIGIIHKLHQTDSLAEKVAAELRGHYTQYAYVVREVGPDDDMTPTDDEGEQPAAAPPVPLCTKQCPFPMTQAELDALGGAHMRKCSKCPNWSILPVNEHEEVTESLEEDTSE